MSSQYRNIFVYYRGPTRSDADGAADARQIEDNTTKALINTLDLASADVVASFLASLGIPAARTGPAFEYFLQGGPALESAPTRRLLVITAGDNAASATWTESVAVKGRIDAAIHVPRELLVAIEAKVGAALDLGQLDKHANDWRIPGRQADGGVPPEWVFTTWADVHRWALAERRRGHDPATSLLLEQLAQYLEIIGVTPFSGFRVEDFELLAARRAIVELAKAQGTKPAPADLTEAHLVKDRVSKLWDAILPALTPAERMAIGDIHVGSLRAQGFRIWAQTNAGQDGVNFTFELDPEQLELDLVAWTGAQVELFERWLATRGARDQLATLDGFELVVWRRRAIADKTGKPYWMHDTYEEIDRIPMPPADDLDHLLAHHRAGCEAGWELLAYHLRRAWPRAEVLASGHDLAADAAAALKSAIPLLHEINWKQRVALRATDALPAGHRSLPDYSVALTPDSEPDPLDWQVVAEGPAMMVTSPSGMHARGIRYFVGVWPGPGPSHATFVTFTLTKSYASGGREGHITLLYYGPDLRAAVRKANADAQDWRESEHFLRQFQPSDDDPLDEALVLEALRSGHPLYGPDWSELDALAVRAYNGRPASADTWAGHDEPCVMGYVRMLD